MNTIQLTELEKATLRQGLDYGYAYDSEDEKGHFICYGFGGKQERGAAASLVKKGIITIWYDKEDDNLPYVNCGSNYTIADIEAMIKPDVKKEMTHHERAIYFRDQEIRVIHDLEEQYKKATTEEEKEMLLDRIGEAQTNLNEINGYLELDELGIEY